VLTCDAEIQGKQKIQRRLQQIFALLLHEWRKGVPTILKTLAIPKVSGIFSESFRSGILSVVARFFASKYTSQHTPRGNPTNGVARRLS
jgi:hypothetical protein